MADDKYSILGVPKTASQADIKTAYLKLAREKHPDRFKDGVERDKAAQRFQLINEAFNLLRDEERRRKYDDEQEWQKKPPGERAKQHYKDGKYREQTRQYGEALKYYYEAVQVDPDNPTYKLAVARLLGKDRSKQKQAAELPSHSPRCSSRPSCRRSSALDPLPRPTESASASAAAFVFASALL